jgi:hypothetical protein
MDGQSAGANPKEKGRCESCSKGGGIEVVEVTRLDATGPVIRLRLCQRCATTPNAVWRRRFQPVRGAAEPVSP